MSKLLVVFGATGKQGGSVIDCVLADPLLSKQYTIRAMTRDTAKPAARALQEKGVQVIQGDVYDAPSLPQVLQGAHTVFGMTVSIYDAGTSKGRETTAGKALVDAAIAAGAQYFIFSTIPDARGISDGKYAHVEQFDAKAEVEAYIRTKPIKSAFVSPGSFMQNYAGNMAPRPTGDGSYAISGIVTPQTQFPLIDAAADSGKYVAAILAEPEKFEGKVFCAATRLYSMEEVGQIISKETGKTVRYNQIPVDVFRGFLPPAAAQNMVEMFLFIQDFGYYGPETKEKVAWAAENARGKLTTFEEYLIRNPLHLG